MDHITLKCRFLELKSTQIKNNLCIVLGSEPRRKREKWEKRKKKRGIKECQRKIM
jgi:hypothetical protein